ncbi:MAG TPA: acetoacetate--CoA ligase [Solirubrobacteraceae bacterium]|nr:acetoacetate--CoA ligase [Solirubrobacteraceae bacterium]
MSAEPVWTPSPEAIASAQITQYAAHLGRSGASYEELWRWSTEELDAFWSSIVEYFALDLGVDPGPVLAKRRMPGAIWYPGATLNYAAHVFRAREPDAVAIRHVSEVRSQLEEWTWERLERETARIAAGLAACGVGEGDRVCAYMPNIPETVAAFLACASLGAVWSSAAPEFGARSVVDRFAQIRPTVLLAIDGYRYGGRDFDRSEVVARVAQEIGGGVRSVRFGYLDQSGWEDGFLGPEDAELTFRRVAFSAPLWVLYSSGTTGVPKAIVHSQGGMLLEQVKHQHLHLDAQPGDRVFWFTTTGWMMWNFLCGVLLTEASIVLFDGNPGYPSLDRLWDLAAEAGVTCFGTSAAYISACMKAGISPRRGRDLSALRAVGSTGSPLSAEGFRWVYDEVGAGTWLFSTSGGTDVCTAFVVGVPTLPVWLGELQARALGCAVQSWSPEGEPLIGEVGELVITEPMPSMPIAFWGDEDGSRLREAYFEMFPGVWRHGDWIEITDRGTAIISGRSDSTINRGGVRMGTAEIYSAVLAVDAVIDALVLDLNTVPGHPDGWMPLFVVLAEGEALDEPLIQEIRSRIRADCSPRHVPDEIRQIRAVPRTLSGKVLEVPVKRILSGIDPERAASRESLANPEALDYFVALAREEGAAGQGRGGVTPS